jgi:Fic family protein
VKALMTSRQAKSIARKIVDELESNFVPPYDAEEIQRIAEVIVQEVNAQLREAV